MQRLLIGVVAILTAAGLAAPVGAQSYDDGYASAYDGSHGGHWRESRQVCRCQTHWRGRGWTAGDRSGGYGDHYRGYVEDGTGRRFYDRGGYGVGHFDYGQQQREGRRPCY
jgi:hypothetical protein